LTRTTGRRLTADGDRHDGRRRKRPGPETKKRVYIPEEGQEDKEIDAGAGRDKKDSPHPAWM